MRTNTHIKPVNTIFLNEARKPHSQALTYNREPGNRHDSGLSEVLAEKMGNKYIYDGKAKSWFAYDEGLWSAMDQHLMNRQLAQAMRSLLPKGFSHGRLVSVGRFLEIDLSLDQWTTNPNLLPLMNGILNTQTMEMNPHSPSNKFTWQLPFSFDASANMPITSAWLTEVTNADQNTINIIRGFFRSALLGNGVQKFLEIIGPGGTGKSTIIRLLTMLIGESNTVTTDLVNMESNRFETAAFYQKKLVIISDSIRYGGTVATLKALTGGDHLRLECKHQQQSGTFIYRGAVVIAANESIQSVDYTSGLARRRLPVFFNKKVTDDDIDKWSIVGGIEKAMKQELPGLLNWILLMTEQEMQKAIGRLHSGLSATEREHLCETNKIAQWIDDNLVAISGSITYVGKAQDDPNKKLYPNYREWCIENGNIPIAMSRFSNTLVDVTEHLRLDVNSLRRDSAGKRILGLKIRESSDIDLPTPVTQQLLNGRVGLTESGMLQKIPSPKRISDEAGAIDVLPSASIDADSADNAGNALTLLASDSGSQNRPEVYRVHYK